ncbi:UDP-glucose 4-epimerase GalE [Methylotenera sp.]|uniref:UDP-glucose 4-epimerase GalE n=1 Tax=Methylotenera sp. TaxID=2051956 RepID=UPI00271BB623|nr:UDP-glucose 4-epimerase GalE [Methylotenera sp.]MDO9206478.1 UDP-glucose 4-epimerase GalE [Methylotenera sp.]MDP1523598.1 UDP-glucose 4-epimerase GalE [Methylotenera sp.]MDP2071673.1 UDP-glucose 4-epimerase GalE [Methylotenera sp.]MDP3006763.1 UDP-glucose 4-epimerase GalE [Methylotenera sp.]MDP3819369.1 UDP-glucose 4-epimerase GalE [Methylotenera sp.]
MSILVTGGAGYIGSHTCLELLNADFDVVVLDNFSNSKMESLKRVEKLTGRSLVFIQGDVRDRSCLRELFLQHKITSVIHFAGYKSVGESVRNPLIYYDNNVSGSVVLAEVMAEFGVKRIVFSSSATVYDTPGDNQIREDFPLGPINPYGRSKLMVEQVFQDISASDSEWKIAVLRYFNPVGAHESGMIGEDPNGIPNNLMPYISQVAVGRLAELSVFGSDYPTQDGTGVRDYIHVVDLARGHLAALQALERHSGLMTVNLGTGKGCSVLELIRAFEHASGKAVPYRIVERRPGDSATCYADPSLAESLLGWQAKLDISAMCRDAWRWQSNNPQGY